MNNFRSEVFDKDWKLICWVETKLKKVEWNAVEFSKKDWYKNALYEWVERPKSTFMLYLMNRELLEELSKTKNRKELNWMHIHDCINTDWSTICWPDEIRTRCEAKEILKVWSIFIAMYIKDDTIEDLNLYINIKHKIYETWEDILLLVENIMDNEWINYKLNTK